MMKAPRNQLTVGMCLLLCVALMAGCHKQASTPQTMDVTQVPAVIQSAFSNVDPAIQADLDAVQNAVKNQDPAAITTLMNLLHRSDLTPEQRAAAGRCLPPLLAAARQAADKGDQRAVQAISAYKVSK